MPGILVGVDGSDHASHALEWAMKMAVALHLPLTVLTVHEVAASHWTGNPIVYPEDRTAQEDARQAAEKAVAEAAGRLGPPSPDSVTVLSVSGNAARELIEASRHADLVVVGSRRRRVRQPDDGLDEQPGCPSRALSGCRHAT
jgi:nucleotide-binding universal stress UspA family protein